MRETFVKRPSNFEQFGKQKSIFQENLSMYVNVLDIENIMEYVYK